MVFQTSKRAKSKIINFMSILLGMMFFLMTTAFWGCGNSSDTVSAVRNATSNPIIATITSPATDVLIGPGNIIKFEASASGGVGDPKYSWSFPGGDPQNSDENKVDVNFVTKGTYTVALTVTDDLGNSSSDTVKVTVSDAAISNLIATIINPSRDITVSVGDTITFIVEWSGGTANNEGTVTVGFTWVAVSASGDSITLGQANPIDGFFNEAGVYTVTVTVKDGFGNVASDSVTVTVTEKK